MTYELVEQLKKAGYPIEMLIGGVLKFPTLSELIEACGEEFESLTQTLHEDAKWKWTACTSEIRTFGNTPEEAVANLYLSLNKNIWTKN